jgi:hypothetical protein
MSELTADETAGLTVTFGDYLKPARISYAKIFQPEKNDLSGKDEYSAMFLIDKDNTVVLDALEKAIDAAIKKEWGDDRPARLRIPLRDGDKDGPGGVPESATAGAEPYGGHMFINAKNGYKPDVRDQKSNIILDPHAIVSGDYVLASVKAWAYDNKSKGVSFSLNGIQLVRKGDPLGNSFDGSKVFGKIPVAADVAGSDLDSMMK